LVVAPGGFIRAGAVYVKGRARESNPHEGTSPADLVLAIAMLPSTSALASGPAR